MKTLSSLRFLVAASATCLALTLPLIAQEPPAKSDAPAAAVENPAPPADTPAPQTPPPAPAADTPPGAEPATTDAPPATETPPPPPAQPENDRENLRVISEPATETATEPTAPAAPEAEAEPVAETKTSAPRTRTYSAGGSSEFPFGDHTVPEGSRVNEVVSILGSSTVYGETRSDVVSIFGHTNIGPAAKIGGAAVAVLGRVESRGEVDDEVVSVLGGVFVDGRVKGEVVSVLGDMELGPNAIVEGDIVVVGGTLKKDPKAVFHGNEVQVPFLAPFGNIEWLTTWVKRCLMLGRPLAFGQNLGWAWAVASAFLVFYLLLALLFPRAVVKCAETMENRPGSTIIASVLTVLLTPVAVVLLAFTVIGAVLVPFFGAGLMFAGLFGKAVMLAWIGRRFTKLSGNGSLAHPVFAVLIGGALVMLLYTVYGSFLLYKLLSWLGTGVVVYTILLSMQREKPASAIAAGSVSPGVPPPPPVAGEAQSVSSVGTPPVVPSMPFASSGFVGGDISGEPIAGAAVVTDAPPPAAQPVYTAIPPVPASSLPRADLFVRLGALLLDIVLVGLIIVFLNGPLPEVLELEFGGFFLLLAAYAAVMWKTKGTTIGGIVCGLKVVRLDNRELDWSTAIVRALSCFLSMIVVGLGFIWVAIDDEKQSWHDKIAGTAVVRVPKGVSLL